MVKNDSDLDRYIQLLSEVSLRGNEDKTADPARMKEIALEAGFSEQDLAAMEQEVDLQVRQAEGFMAQEMFEEALPLLKNSAAARPGDKKINLALAETAFKFWEKRQNKPSEIQALSIIDDYARKFPEEPKLYNFLKVIKKGGKTRKIIYKLIPGLIALFLALIVLFLLIVMPVSKESADNVPDFGPPNAIVE